MAPLPGEKVVSNAVVVARCLGSRAEMHGVWERWNVGGPARGRAPWFSTFWQNVTLALQAVFGFTVAEIVVEALKIDLGASDFSLAVFRLVHKV